jgi:hypothetical protein
LNYEKILLTLIAGGMVFSALPSIAATVGGVLKSTGGVIVGAFYGGMLAGPMRGGYAKGGEWAGPLSEELGGGTLAKAVGYPVGAWAGSIVGVIVGIGKGVANGVMHGIDNPFSDENLSVDGSSFGDFDPFDFNY